MFPEVPTGSLQSKCSSKFLIEKKNLLLEECVSLLRSKFRNVHLSVDIVVEEIIAL